MPLLKRKAFEKSSGSEFLRDDEEVFHCEITDEIFRDYEEYCERIILVNSMVWSCEMTGKPNLTYTEALDSEKNARKSLRDFPMELRVPILYLASRTKRCTFAEMLDDVFNFVRDRYFVGETVEACLEGDAWAEGQILSVTAPKQQPDTGSSPSKPSSLYCYEVEQFDDELEGDALGRVAIVPHDRVRRSRGVFTREKNKLYLKQFVEQGPGGVIRIKENTMEKYNISKVKFDQIFTGAAPEFPSSKKFDKVTTMAPTAKAKLLNGQKKLQQTMAKYITKIDKFEGTTQSKNMEISKDKLTKLDHKSGKVQKAKNGIMEAKNLKEEMKMMGEQMKQKKLEEKLKKKEKSVKLAAYLKEWNKQKEDLELEDHNALPQSIPVEIPGLPNKYFGDFVAILEFFREFSKPLRLRDAFHNGVDLETLRRALITKEVAGPLSDIMQVLLQAIFSLQDDEAEDYNEDNVIQDINDIEETPEEIGMTAMRGIQLATAASRWPQTYMATPLSQLPIDSQTFSEVLRLHLLASGSSGGDRCVKWRYQQRGGYSSQDDPGLWLRIRKPHIIKALSRKHLTQLPLSYKITIITCLINQILSYATIRDLIEEKLEKSKNLKLDLRSLQAAEKKREIEVIVSRQKIKRDAAAKKEEEKLTGDAVTALEAQALEAIEALAKDSEQKKEMYEKKLKSMQQECFGYQSYLGSDRAHRRYWVYETISGLFIEHDERFSGICIDTPVQPNPSLATAPPEAALSYVQKLFESEVGGYSDKENDAENSPSKKSEAVKSPKKIVASSVPENNLKLMQELLMCTANPVTCSIHSNTHPRTRWTFLYSPEHIDELLGSLNKRGIRENDLKQIIENEKDIIVKYIAKCPANQLNPAHDALSAAVAVAVKPWTKKYMDSNLSFPAGTDCSEVLEMSLRDAVIDLEEKLFMGCLGELQIKDRTSWRESIMKRGYDKQCHTLTWGPQRTLTDDLHIINGKTKVDAEANAAAYKEPGYFLGTTGTVDTTESDDDADTKDASIVKDDLPVVKDLASALLQLGQAVMQKYLKRPLGYDEKERLKDSGKSPLEFDALRRWETSLMECSSFAQVMLHLITLDNSVLWSKSILNANCRLCRRRNNPENMLLCDACNKGHHMYCLKPKLTKVPEGDWFCHQCTPKEKTPQKRNRKVFNFKEEDSISEIEDNDGSEGSVSVALCTGCKSGGALVQCSVCADGWHSECLPSLPQRRQAFSCPACSKPKHKNNHRELNRGVRRCAASAMTNLNHYAKMLKNTPRQQSDSEDSIEETLVVKSKRKRQSKESSPVEQMSGNSKKPRRANSVIQSESSDEPVLSAKMQKKRASKDPTPLTNGLTNGKTHTKKSKHAPEDTSTPRRASAPNATRLLIGFSRKSRRSEAVHYEALEELLTDVMKHKDSWPFNAPVTVDEVPDYFEIITEPMDFETIKGKLTRKKYASDSQVMSDSSLVFNNCFTYNHEEDSVAKAGVRLQKFFDKRCKELSLPGLPFSALESKSKKNRTLN